MSATPTPPTRWRTHTPPPLGWRARALSARLAVAHRWFAAPAGVPTRPCPDPGPTRAGQPVPVPRLAPEVI